MVEYFVYTEKANGSNPFILKVLNKVSKYIYLKKSDLFHKNIQINVDKQTRGFSLSKMYILNNFMLYPFEKTKKNLEISNLGCKYILGVRNHTL